MAESDFVAKHCIPCSLHTPALNENEIKQRLQKLNSWIYAEGAISREFRFKNYEETTAFVNAVAWIAHREDHHPDICFGYHTCWVSFKTHKINGMSENDFIAAAKVDALLE